MGTHAFFVALVFAVGLAIFLAEARRRAVWDERLLPVLAGIAVGGALLTWIFGPFAVLEFAVLGLRR